MDLNFFEQLLVKAGEAIKPADPAIAGDIELGALILGFATSLFQHHKKKVQSKDSGQ